MERKTTWRDEAAELLRNRPVSLKLAKIAEEVGVSVGWLRAFGRGDIPEPSVVSIETLTAYLKNYNKGGK